MLFECMHITVAHIISLSNASVQAQYEWSEALVRSRYDGISSLHYASEVGKVTVYCERTP